MVNLAVCLTVSRMLLAPFVYFAGFSNNLLAYGVLFAVAGLTDALDGFVARYFNQVSKLGASLDNIADILFYPSGILVVLFVSELWSFYWVFILLSVCYVLSWLVLFSKRYAIVPFMSGKPLGVFAYIFVLYSLFAGFSLIFTYFILLLAVFHISNRLFTAFTIKSKGGRN